MYGLLIECLCHSVKSVFGDEIFNQIRESANITHLDFKSTKVYSETVIPRLARAASKITGMPTEDIMEAFGVFFVSFVSRYGYDRIMKVLGRTPRDFFNNLDNLHEYFRFSYPKISPPSFFVTDEGPEGLTLQYRSKRKGYSHYTKGQIKQVLKDFFDTEIDIEIIEIKESGGHSDTKMRLRFDNREAHATSLVETITPSKLPLDKPLKITTTRFFALFPFHMVLDRNLKIQSVGDSILAAMPHLVDSMLDDVFLLERPLIEFTWKAILTHTNNTFELHSVDVIENRHLESNHKVSDELLPRLTTTLKTLPVAIQREALNIGTDSFGPIDHLSTDENSHHSDFCRRLILRGQMLYMENWKTLIFLGTPVMENLDHLYTLGLYITDLSIHDSSRELLLAGTQQTMELKLVLDQEQKKTRVLEESMKKLDEEVKKADTLLHQMMPQSVAERLRSGEPTLSTCEVFDVCTVLFSDVAGFAQICTAISPMQVVTMLNLMYTSFDNIIEKHNCYKVETIGDAYMIVGGVPEKSDNHALEVAEMAFDMLRCMKGLRNPADKQTKSHLKLRIGVHSGMVVAGVVGVKMPRYCLFGDTVNVASRMETSSVPMKINISEVTREWLLEYPQYEMEERSAIKIKGKGDMLTYWLTYADKNKMDGINYGY